MYAEAIAHRGFSVVDTLQVCVTFRDMYASYNERVYELEGHDPRDEEQARAKILEWDYRSDGPVALARSACATGRSSGAVPGVYRTRPLDSWDAALAEAFADLT